MPLTQAPLGRPGKSARAAGRGMAGGPVGVGDVAGGEVDPALAAVVRDVEAAVVGAGVDEAAAERAFGDRRDGGPVGDAVVERGQVVVGHLSHDRDGAPVGARGEVAQGLPRVPPVRGLPHDVRARVQGRRVVRRDDERAVPVGGRHRVAEALLLEGADLAPGLPVAASGDMSDGVAGANGGALTRARVEARQVEVLGLGVDDGVVGRVRQVDEPVAAAQARPVAVDDAVLAPGLAGPHPRAVVLETAVDVVGAGHVDADAVVLADREVGDVEPVEPAVVGDAEAAVVGLHDVAGVGGVDPDEAVVAVEALGRDGEGAAPVVREGVAVDHVDALVVAGIDGDLAGVHGTGVPVAHQLPRVAPVLGAVDAGAPLGVGGGRVVAVPLLDAHVDDAGVAAVDGDAHAADHVLGEAARDAGAGQPLPGVAAVHAAVERAAGAAAVEAPRAPLPLVGGGVDDVGLVGIERDIHGAGVLVDLQDGLPGGAAVGAAVEAALARSGPTGGPSRRRRRGRCRPGAARCARCACCRAAPCSSRSRRRPCSCRRRRPTTNSAGWRARRCRPRRWTCRPGGARSPRPSACPRSRTRDRG